MKKKLIEVALPLDAINRACAADKNIKTGHIRNLHKWFAPMPLPAWRALIFASLVDDPANHLSPREADQERQNLFSIIEQLVADGSKVRSSVLEKAKAKIRESHTGILPAVFDPFCGGGSTIVEAQKLGLQSFASDLNPIPVMITTLLTRAPQIFENQPPINPVDRKENIQRGQRADGLFADFQHYARRVQEIANTKVGYLHPTMDTDGKEGEKIVVQSYIWARTVRSPSPIFSDVHVPLVRSFELSKRSDCRAWIAVVRSPHSPNYSFEVRDTGHPDIKGTTGREVVPLCWTVWQLS